LDQQIELIPLLCVRCKTPIPADLDQTAWVCASCGQGMALDLQRGLAAQEVFYLAGIPPGQTGKPYWAAQGQVSLSRQTYRGNDQTAAATYWAQPRLFFIPAWNISVEEKIAAGRRMMDNPPVLQQGPAVRFEPVTLLRDDIQAATEFVVMMIEAARADKLRELKFDLKLSRPALWILPS
jgi:hypothetical protein